jgi:hypothetical protein
VAVQVEPETPYCVFTPELEARARCTEQVPQVFGGGRCFPRRSGPVLCLRTAVARHAR